MRIVCGLKCDLFLLKPPYFYTELAMWQRILWHHVTSTLLSGITIIVNVIVLKPISTSSLVKQCDTLTNETLPGQRSD